MIHLSVMSAHPIFIVNQNGPSFADTINSLCFSPNRYWLCAATGPAIKIWDLESKNQVEELKPEVSGELDSLPIRT